jgi:hypothetical protein
MTGFNDIRAEASKGETMSTATSQGWLPKGDTQRETAIIVVCFNSGSAVKTIKKNS